ncbi:MAG: thioredoxin [Nanoarchaeota archaeon]|nr:thioredoxin [Nanoarchaeota archaeon]
METNDSNFEKDVIKKSKTIPVLVDFYASWCQPCVMLSPILEKLEKEYKDKAAIVKVNIDSNQKTAQKYGIMSIPSLKLFKDGKIVEELMGLVPEGVIKDALDQHI